MLERVPSYQQKNSFVQMDYYNNGNLDTEKIFAENKGAGLIVIIE